MTDDATKLTKPVQELLTKQINDIRFNQIFGLGFGLVVAIVAYPAVPSLGPGGGPFVFLIWIVVMAAHTYSCERKIGDAKRVLSKVSEPEGDAFISHNES
jgi:hypothetical protein